MKIQVAYGRVDVAASMKCPRCGGNGEAETAFRSGLFRTCPYCKGSGVHPHPSAYTYTTTDDVKPGDIVLVPANWLKAETQEATVVAVGSDYDGPVNPIVRVLERAP